MQPGGVGGCPFDAGVRQVAAFGLDGLGGGQAPELPAQGMEAAPRSSGAMWTARSSSAPERSTWVSQPGRTWLG